MGGAGVDRQWLQRGYVLGPESGVTALMPLGVQAEKPARREASLSAQEVLATQHRVLRHEGGNLAAGFSSLDQSGSGNLPVGPSPVSMEHSAGH